MSARPMRAVLAALITVAAAAVPVLTAASPAAAATFRSVVQETPATDTWSPYKACTAAQSNNPADNCAEVHAMAQLGNTIYVGGDFTELHQGSQVVSGLGGLAAFNATTHQPITGVTLPRFVNTSGIAVRAIAIDPNNGDPRIYVGGGFNKVGFGTGTPSFNYQRLVAIKPDGTLAAAYNPDQAVSAMTISGGDLYVGGSLTTIRSNPATGSTTVNVNRAAAINLSTGAVDPAWAPTFAVTKATNPNDTGAIKTPAVTALAAGQGRIYIGGHFDSVGPTTGGGMETHIMIVAVSPTTGVVDSGFQAVTNPIDYDQHYWSIMSIATVGNIGDSNAGVLAAAGGLTNRTYRFGTAGKNVWTFLSDGDNQALAVSGDDVYIGGHFQCVGPYPIPIQGSCTPPKPSDPQPGSPACANADPASMPTCFYDPNDAVQNRTHLAMVSYSQTVSTKQGGATYVTPRVLSDSGVEPFNPRLNPIYSPYYYGVWTINFFGGDMWVGGVWKTISVPTGPEVPKSPDQQTYTSYDISKLAVFPAANPLPATTTTVTSSQNPTTVGDPVTFTANVAPTSVTGTPTGTVQFSIDGTPVGTAQTLVGGSASYATSGLAAGSHVVSAAYSGDASFADSAGSLSGGQTVNAKPGPSGPLSLSIGDTTVLEGNSGTSNASFPVTLSGDPQSGQPVTVHVATSNGTATAGSDYTAVSQTLTWNSGDPSTQTVDVPIIGDTNPEGAESFMVTLSAPTNATLADATATGTINDEEGPIAFSVNDVSKLEGNSGTSPMTFTVTASPAPAAGQTVTVKVKSTAGTAKAGSDFKAVALHAISFTSATPTQQVSVPIIGDKAVESNETVFLTLSAPSAGTVIADAGGLGTIINDDGSVGATPPPSISVANTMVVEGTDGTSNAVFTLSLPSSPTQTTSVKVATVNGTALAGTVNADYTALPLTTVTWAPGDPADQTVSVPITTDSIGEANETFTLALSSPVNAVIGDASALATIVDDDGGLPRISIGDAWTVEGNSGTHAMQFPVTLSQPLQAGQKVTVKYATAAGTATAGTDFTGLSGKVLTWLPGDPQTKMISVTIKGDTAVEPDETLKVNLSGITGGAVLSDAQGIGTILNDD